MHVIEEIDIAFDEEEIARRHGLDRMVKRKGSLSTYIDEAKALIQPRAVYIQLRIAGIDRDEVMLENGHSLKSRLLAEKLQKTPEVALYIVTIGHRLEKKITELSSKDMLHSMVLDFLGTHAVAFLRNHIQSLVEGKMKIFEENA